MQNYNEALETLKGRTSRKIGNNTYLEKIDDHTIGVRLHKTHVVIYRDDGTVTLNSGGWRTVTTKDRINEYSPVSVSQKKGVWFVSYYKGNGIHRELGEFWEGMIVNGAGEIVSEGRK